MATLIPAEFPPLPWGAMPADQSGWEGERIVYDLLRSAPAEWTVLYDLMPPAVSHTAPQQIDFLVIVPKKAILVLEVKNGIHELREGSWRPVSRDEDNQGTDPLRQARAARDALRAQIATQFGSNAVEYRFPYGNILVLTDPASSNPPEGMQAITLESYQSADLFHARLDYFADRAFGDRATHGRVPLPHNKRLNGLLDFLIPSVPAIPTEPPEFREANDSEERIVLLSDQQFEGVQSAMDNARIRFEGAAGTGKTVVAIETARRRYEAGERVALVCFNRLLGEWLREYLADEIASPSDAGGTLTVGRIWNDFARPAIESDSRRASSFRREMNRYEFDDDTLYSEIFPRYARQAFRSGGQFDYLIVDEFQDLCREPFLEVLDASLIGGLSGGKWAVFADFRNQALHEAFNKGPRQLEEEGGLEANLEPYCTDATLRNLTLNCRNTPPIAEAFSRMSRRGKPEVSQSAWSGVRVVAPRYRYWQEPAHLEDALDEEVTGLVARGWGTRISYCCLGADWKAWTSTMPSGTTVRG